MNKPDVLGLKDAYVAWRGYSLHVRQVVKEAITENIAKAQRDVDVAYYEPLINNMYGVLERVRKWLDGLADTAETNARTTRFITMREAWESDARNYRTTSNDLKQALTKAERRAG